MLNSLRPLVFTLEMALRQMTAGYRDLPDFVIVGAQRSGTTSLFKYLSQHPCVVASSKKEIHYFSLFYDRGQRWYRAHFPTSWYKNRLRKRALSAAISGEASPYYMFHPVAARRMAQVIPSAKLIVMLRNPVDRAYSHYLHILKQAKVVEKLSFEDAIQAEEERLSGEFERLQVDERYAGWNFRHYSYLKRGIYIDQLERLEKYFPAEQILILPSEAFFANTPELFANVLRYLNLPDWKPNEFQVYNPGQVGEAMKPETRQWLVEYFRPHNRRLYQYLGEDLGWDE